MDTYEQRNVQKRKKRTYEYGYMKLDELHALNIDTIEKYQLKKLKNTIKETVEEKF